MTSPDVNKGKTKDYKTGATRTRTVVEPGFGRQNSFPVATTVIEGEGDLSL